MEIIFFLLIPAIFAVITHNMAKAQGRQKSFAAVMGFFFGIFAVAVYAMMGDTEERKKQRIKEVTGNV